MTTHRYASSAWDSLPMAERTRGRARDAFVRGLWIGLGAWVAIAALSAILVGGLFVAGAFSGGSSQAARDVARLDAERAAADQMAEEIASRPR